MPARFVHLHLHTEFSLADSTIRVPEKPDYARPEKAGDTREREPHTHYPQYVSDRHKS